MAVALFQLVVFRRFENSRNVEVHVELLNRTLNFELA